MKNSLYFILAILVLSLAVFTHPSFSEDASQRSSLEEKKSEILKDIETLELGLEVMKGCMERAKTEEELRQCREEEKVRRFYEVMDKLSEIGMSVEERRIKRLERRR